MRKFVTMAAVVATAGLGACGGDDDATCARFVEPTEGQADMVLLSDLGYGEVEGIDFDPPVPSDVGAPVLTDAREPSGVAVSFETAATLEQLDGYYYSVFSECRNYTLDDDPATGERSWIGSDDRSTADIFRFLDGTLVVEHGPYPE